MPTLIRLAALVLIPIATLLWPVTGVPLYAALVAGALLAGLSVALRLPQALAAPGPFAHSWVCDETWLLDALAGLAQRARAPLPRLIVFRAGTACAFAIQPVASRPEICVSTALLERLDRGGIMAVLAHEIAHVRHRDTVHAGACTAVSDLMVLVAGHLLGTCLSTRLHPGAALLVLAATQTVVVACGSGLVMAHRRYCERRADATAAALVGVLPLRSALQRLQPGPGRRQDQGVRARVWSLWHSHPSVALRLAALKPPARLS